MSDVAQLGISIDSTSTTAASAALDKLTAAGQSAADASDALTAASGKSETVIRAIQAAADRAGVSFDTMNQRVDAASTSATKAASATTSHATALAGTGKAANSASSELTSLDKITGVLESRMLGLGSNLGLFGQILQAVGPAGLTAAAGLGAIVVGVTEVVESANRMGDLAIQLQNVSTVAGVTSTQLQALDSAGASLGVSASSTNEYLVRFTEQLATLKTGSGDLYTQLLKISPVLTAQISTATSTTAALNLLAQAYAKAGAGQNALANAAAGGRNGAQFGLELGDIASKGGVDAVTSSVNQLDLITNAQTKDWATLKAQIDDTSQNARNNLASIFTGPVLAAEKSFFDGWLSWTESLKEFANSDAFSAIMALMKLRSQVANATLVPNRSAPTAAPTSMANFQSPQQNYGSFQSGAVTTLDASGNTPLGTPAQQARQAADAVSFLGSAATASDKYNASVLKLNATIAAQPELVGLQSRALAGLELDKLSAQASGYSGALGAMPVQQQTDKKEKEGQDERDQRRLPKAA
jgi:hypothetical protein